MSKQANNTNEQLMQRRTKAIPRGPFHVAPIFAAKALGATVWDVEGKTYLDFCGGIGVQNVGHNHPKVLEAVTKQAEAFLHTCFHVMPYEVYVRLAERLNRAAPIDGECMSVFFNSGAEAVENAVKAARVFTGRTGIAAFERGFHGRTLLAMSLTGKCRPYTAGFGPFAPEVYRLPLAPFFLNPNRGDAEVERECRRALDHLSHYHVETESLACLIVEPVLGEGGFHPIHKAAFALLRQWTADNGIVLIADEVQAGFGRCGALFACERYGVRPDLFTLAKSMAAGTVLSGVTGRAAILNAPGVGGLGGTYGGNPVACAAANAVLDIIEEEALCDRANTIGDRVMACFSRLKDTHDIVSDARGLGAMCALEIVNADTGEPDPNRVARICRAALERGLLIMSASGNVIRTLMPLTISDADLERGLAILEEAVNECVGSET